MKIMCIMDEGYEELEAIGTIALLRRAGIEIDVFAVNNDCVTGRFNLTLANVTKLEAANLNDYDCLFLPGGPHYAKLENNATVMDILKSFIENKRIVAAICAAPTILGHAGYLKGKKYTCFTSMNEDFGGEYIDQYAVMDDNIITGRSAAAVIDFAFLIIEKICGVEKANEVKASIYY